MNRKQKIEVEKQRKIEARVLKVLGDREVSLVEIAEALKMGEMVPAHFEPSDEIRCLLWAMAADNKIDFTRDWKIKKV